MYMPIDPKRPFAIIEAILFTVTAIFIGYMALGIIPAFLFMFGYIGGLMIWLFATNETPFRKIALPYCVTLALFIVHKIEEREMGFFPALSKLTGVPVPDPTSWQAILLYAVGCAWLLIPLLIWKRSMFGYFLAWTFFASMGLTELAHFAFPLFKNGPYSYFPGMWSVIGLAPAAWWGMYKLVTGDK